MSLKPWREIAIPHQDVLRGTFQQAEFAADISRVHEGTATDEYQNPALFFQRTFITEGMRLLLDSVVKRLVGRGGDPVIQLQTAFGGGKTHTMLAVYHLASGKAAASQLQGIPSILDAAGIVELPKARIAVLDGINLLDLASKPRLHGSCKVQTIWGDLAWQLGGESGYELIRQADQTGTAPGKGVLAELLAANAPCIILMDELVRYVAQFEEGKTLTGGTYDTQLSFIQALTEAIKSVPTAILLASLPFSEREAGSLQGVKALRALEHYFGRVQALWKPVATEEAFEIVRRRLFENIGDNKGAEDTCRAFADYYVGNNGDFPTETQDSHYFERLKHAYPIHPEVFDRLYEDWSSLDNFQRTRGVLKLMAKVIHRLWKDGNNDLLIMPGSVPLYDPDVRNETIYYLQQGWDPVLEKDIDGERAATTELDGAKPLFGAIHACRRLSRTIFLGSAPDAGAVGGAKNHHGLEQERVLLGCVQPGQVLGHYKDGIRAIVDKLQYLNSASNRYWFDARPNLRREMEDRKRRFLDKEDVFPLIRDKLQKTFAQGVFGGIHTFTASGDVPDDWALRLVILPPDATFSRTSENMATIRAAEILKNRGDQPRQKQNRLIFMAADTDTISRLRDQVRSVLAWQSIVSDVKDARLNLDQLQSRQASKSLEEANEALTRMIKETYKWLLAPMQEATPAKDGKGGISEIVWEHHTINPATINRTQEIERILKDNELLITEWSPIHLADQLRKWFWKDDVPAVGALNVWQKSCCYLYLPRLSSSSVFSHALAAGAGSRDFFGFAYGRENERYLGFSFGNATTPILDDALLLVEPKAATVFTEVLRAEEEAWNIRAAILTTDTTSPVASVSTLVTEKPRTPGLVAAPEKVAKKRVFFGTVELDPVRAKLQFADVVDEVLMQFASRAGVKIKVSVEIQAESDTGFDDGIQRGVRENCAQLKFKNSGFEE